MPPNWTLHLIQIVRGYVKKRPTLLVGCVALVGLLSCYFFLKLRRISNGKPPHPPNTQNISHRPSHTTTAGELNQKAVSTFPRLADLTKRTVVSLATLGTVVYKTSEHNTDTAGAELVTGVPESLEALRDLASKADVYLITACPDSDSADATYDAVHALLSQHGIFDAGVNPCKHLLCSTVIGKAHIARQLEAKIHIDVDEQVLNHLQRFTPHLMLINKDVQPQQRGGTFVASSLQQQFHK